MSIKQLQEKAKELQIKGYYKMKKDELEKAIEATQTINPVEEVKETIVEAQEQQKPVVEAEPVKPSREKKSCALYDASGSLVKEFGSVPELIKYCIEQKIANSGWIINSLNTGKKFYEGKNGKFTAPHKKSGFIGIGYYASYKEQQAL